ncbi:2-oxo acid dehydrogenase subunit E2 [Amylibacter sp.]|nr:2-oxo acid dehydrogenase subunit E2 [Amylibacter sp.]
MIIDTILAHQINPNDETFKVVSLLVKNGALVSKNEAILEIETSKATQEIETASEGYVEFLIEQGTDVTVGTPLANICSKPLQPSAYSEVIVPEIGRKITKNAQKMIKKYNLDTKNIPGEGIITESLLNKYIVTQAETMPSKLKKKISKSQRAVSKNLRQSVATNVHARMTAKFSIDLSILEPGTTILDMVIKASADAIKKFPSFNNYLVDDLMHINNDINIGFTLSLDANLTILTVPACANDPIEKITSKRTDAMMVAMRGSAVGHTQQPTFVVSLIESENVEMHYPLIFPGNSAILGIALQPTASKKINQIGICLAYDHRFINGSAAASFLDTIIASIPKADKSDTVKSNTR